jgi:hypothetical protein
VAVHCEDCKGTVEQLEEEEEGEHGRDYEGGLGGLVCELAGRGGGGL